MRLPVLIPWKGIREGGLDVQTSGVDIKLQSLMKPTICNYVLWRPLIIECSLCSQDQVSLASYLNYRISLTKWAWSL